MTDNEKGNNRTAIIVAIIMTVGVIFAALIPSIINIVSRPTPSPAATPTSIPIASVSPSPNPQPTSVAGKYAPVILDIKTEELGTAGVLYFDIHFRDPDGDFTTVTYNAVSSTIPISNLTISNYRIPPSLSAQEADSGTVVKDSFTCWYTTTKNPLAYSVILDAIIEDSAGNKSDPYRFEFDCK